MIVKVFWNISVVLKEHSIPLCKEVNLDQTATKMVSVSD